LDDWITDALPVAVAADSRADPPVSPPDAAYPNFNGGFRAAISTESTTGFGRSATVYGVHAADGRFVTRYCRLRRTASGRAMVDCRRPLSSGMNAWANPTFLSTLRPEQFINGRQLLGSQSSSDG
jgi:hypothetical protein